MVTPLNDNAIPPATVEYLLRPHRNHNPPPAHVSSEIRSYIMRYNRTPTRGPIFTPVQKDWLKDHIPQYMQWPTTSDETITFVQTMLIDFDHMWPLHQKLWPGSNVHILLTDSMHAKLTAEMLILRGNIKGHMLDPPFPKSKEVIPSSISWTSDPAGLWSINSERDTMVSVRLDSLINLLQCLSLDDQKTLSQALDIGTDTGTDGDTSNDNITVRMGLGPAAGSTEMALAALPAVSDDPPATTIDSPREAAPVASPGAAAAHSAGTTPTSAPATAHAAAPTVVVPAGHVTVYVDYEENDSSDDEDAAAAAAALANDSTLIHYRDTYFNVPVDATPPLYYVTRGRYIGIFSGWDATGPKVLGVSRAIYHKVDSIEQGINIVKGAIDRGDASQAL
ncbi:hypothetical protein DEU56DRAFT_760499 [Suillus clintonianus]|uniref:uncharacterized protein n=1 Tax=Suillus clintonianus TaxID=1904413 RepID=UPI001B87A006|nr:uncharacterized protein DEU56DRAFT_760499 [Suillus clintonianus]KAG2121983.1 hypothetical protein DEU56DRAFT_760499 [Suillus clintonianus]